MLLHLADSEANRIKRPKTMSKPESLSFDDNNLPYIDLGTAIIRMEKEEPPEWALEIARRELRETPEVVEKAFQHFIQLLDEQTCLKVPRDDFYLRMFLRPTHYYPESAMKRIKNFYSLDTRYTHACSDILPDKLQHVFEAEILQLLPNRDQHGRRILVLEVGKKWKPSVVPLNDLFRGVQLMVFGSMVEPLSQICGSVVIIDVADLPMGNVLQFTPYFAAMILDYVQDCICMRLKAVHIVNNSYVFNVLFSIFGPFIRQKLRKRIFFHGKDFKSLHNHIDKSVLPQKYGGSTTWELPPGKLLGEFFRWYNADFEMANKYGYIEGCKEKK